MIKNINKFYLFLSFLYLIAFSNSTKAQSLIENLLVETYYVADGQDATDLSSGGIESGSKTYRVFLDLAEGVSIDKVFSEGTDSLYIRSSQVIFNHEDRGEVLGADMNKSRLDEGIVAMDSWLTIGLASNKHWGVPKHLDLDGTIDEFLENDGGSEEIPGGLMANEGGEMGLSLSVADGLILEDVDSLIPGISLSDFFDILSPSLGEQSDSLELNTNAVFIQSDTLIQGPTVENLVLIAQITTAGELSMRFNVRLYDSFGNLHNLVSDSTNTEQYSPFLLYPTPDVQCGCPLPEYAEFDPEAFCSDESLCLNLAVLGCTDPNACNFDPDANVNFPQLCCYTPDSCGLGLDFETLCGALGTEEHELDAIQLGPNPFQDIIYLTWPSPIQNTVQAQIIDLHGRTVALREFDKGILTQDWSLEQLESGLYYLHLRSQNRILVQSIIKTP